MKRKVGIFLTTILLSTTMVGCSKSNVLEEVYKDLDAEETYEKMIEYFNEEVSYYKVTSTTENTASEDLIITLGEAENLIQDEELYCISWNYDEEDTFDSGYIRDNDMYYNLYDIEDEYVYEVEDVEDTEDVLLMSNILEIFDSESYEVKRKDKDGEIIITITIEASVDLGYEYEYTIGSDGLITTYRTKMYFYPLGDDPMLDTVYILSDFNKKSELDIDGAIEELEAYVEDLVE